MNIDSLIYHNGLLALLVGSFVLFIVCVMCLGACTDRGLCCHEHVEMDRLRAHRRNIHALELFEHTCVQMPQMFRHIVEVHPQHSGSAHSILDETPPKTAANNFVKPSANGVPRRTQEIGADLAPFVPHSSLPTFLKNLV